MNAFRLYYLLDIQEDLLPDRPVIVIIEEEFIIEPSVYLVRVFVGDVVQVVVALLLSRESLTRGDLGYPILKTPILHLA